MEKLCRALQTERNELNEKVEVLKGQVSVREADVDLAVHVDLQSCPLNSHGKVGISANGAEEGIQPDAEPSVAHEGSEQTVCLGSIPATDVVD